MTTAETKATSVTCPKCGSTWTCRCGRTPCLFDGSVCDGCQLAHLESEDEATLCVEGAQRLLEGA